MGANSDKITVSVRLPNSLFWELNEVAKTSKKSKSDILRPLIEREMKRMKRLFNSHTR